MSKNLFNLLLIVGSFALYYLIINPLYTGVGSVWAPERGVKALRELDIQYTDTLVQAKSIYDKAKDLRTEYSNIPDESKNKMNIMVPSSIDPVRLMSEVNSIAIERGAVLEGLSYNENVRAGSARGSYGVSFAVKTTYSKFKELMHDYETSMRLFTIKSVTFSAPDKETGVSSFQVKLETYYIK